MLLVSGVLQACGDDAEATSFRREPAAASTPNPFMDGVNTAPAAPSVGSPVASTSTTEPATTAPTTAPTPAPAVATVTVPPGSSGTFPGNTPGLYGGTQDKAACDATKMAAFLQANPDKAAAWAGVLGIKASGIAGYIALLTPTVLRADTAVTNHGFRNGTATAVPAVLQAGTAVFVDDRGVPVIRCSCGNPLTPPASRRNATFSGSSWSGFSARSVTAVRRSPAPLDDVVLVDPGTRTAFTRPVGTDGDADVPYVPDVAAGDPATPGAGPTTTGDGATTTTTTTSTTSTTSTTVTPPGEPVIFNAEGNGTGGVCAGVPGAAFELRIEGGRVIFSSSETGPIAADGSFDFTVSGTVGGGMGGNLSSHFTGRADPGPPYRLNATREDTVTSPTGVTSTCISTYTGVRRDLPADPTTTTTTASTTTTAPAASATPATPTVQTWYFDGRIDEVGSGCDEIGIVAGPGPDGRIRFRDGGPDGHTVTFLGRPSRTLPVDGDNRFNGRLIAAGEGDPDQMEVTTNGGPVPFVGVSTPRPFRYGKGLGGATRVPGTFRWTGCGFGATATPRD